MKIFSGRLRARRAELRISQRDTALRAKVPYSRYMAIENDYREPSKGELGRIARALRSTPAAFVVGKPTTAAARDAVHA